jgi:hypothetical protein
MIDALGQGVPPVDCHRLGCRADDQWHGISRILAYSTNFGWNIPLHWHGIESSILVEYSNIPLLSIPYVVIAGSSYDSELTNTI